MSTAASGASTRRSPVPLRAGLVLASVLALGDVVVSVRQFADGPVMPLAVIVVALLTCTAVPFAWRGAAWARTVVIVTRVLSALTGLPAFFVPGVPAGWVVAAASGIVLSFVVALLLLMAWRPAR
ncbi:hypothetical protein [Sphaerisporangium dianthi]|uniref:Uncharacterized protein n=1 Tax=Sphaerisporangium dianthi TaxID=1436120 RepID=A0ABV9CMW6_9ACTN